MLAGKAFLSGGLLTLRTVTYDMISNTGFRLSRADDDLKTSEGLVCHLMSRDLVTIRLTPFFVEGGERPTDLYTVMFPPEKQALAFNRP